MANATVAKFRITADPSAAAEATEFIKAHAQKMCEDEVLLERFQDLLEHNQLFILVTTSAREYHYSLEPSYPLLEIMAELSI
jgi:hypothetical protein